MSTVEAVDLAQGQDFSRTLLKHTSIRVSEDYLDAFRSHVEAVHYAESEVIFRKGDESDFAILIASGEVEVYDEGSGTVLAVSGEGTLIGELGMISGDPRSASARALTPVRGWKIDRSDYPISSAPSAPPMEASPSTR